MALLRERTKGYVSNMKEDRASKKTEEQELQLKREEEERELKRKEELEERRKTLLETALRVAEIIEAFPEDEGGK